ncbi:ABC transporter ATP-binding protein [Marinilabiliaceae bacterium JC017]|nr:ABC transporter ATP-binding protein [Marinilabiliaceae bacterium JC017]
MTENVIECNGLTHYYGKRCIYENLNFTVPKGRILGLLGKNGTGKTTTINLLNGYLQPVEGECLMFGEKAGHLSPGVKQRIGLLIEGHVQYAFMNIEQIERFYGAFFPNWQREPYYELMKKLAIAPRQKISRMSCGQRSQVALGLILAQDPDLLILDDFSMGLDPGYRRLFVDYLGEYAKAEEKTVFVTSHIIQDMERLIDDCLILDYGKILLQDSTHSFLNSFRRFTFETTKDIKNLDLPGLLNTEVTKNKIETYSFMSPDQVRKEFISANIPVKEIKCETLSLEEAFIGLTGKY